MGNTPRNKNNIIPGTRKSLNGDPVRRSGDMPINCPSGDRINSAPLMRPDIPIIIKEIINNQSSNGREGLLFIYSSRVKFYCE